MYRAGDWITVIGGELEGRTVEITAVRMFATDSGYYVKGVGGLLPPSHVTLARERAGGNPCGAECDARQHDSLRTCDHCRGMCFCHLGR